MKLNHANFPIQEFASWVIGLRWIAGVIALVLVYLSGFVFHLLPKWNTYSLLLLLLVLFIVNYIYLFLQKRYQLFEQGLFSQLTIDLCFLTFALNLSGGLENPLYLVYIFHAIIGAIILSKHKSFVLILLILAAFVGLSAGEYFHIVPHYTVGFMPHEHHSHASQNAFFVFSRAVSFLMVLLVSYYFTLFLTQNIKLREQEAIRLRIEAEEERERLQMLLHTTETELMYLDPGFGLIWSNKSELEGDSFFSYLKRKRLEEAVQKRQALEFEESLLQGSRHLLRRCVVSPVFDETQNLRHISVVVQDITEKKALEARAKHSDRMRILGRLTSVVMHEVGNPLASIQMRLERMAKNPEKSFVLESLGLIEEQIKRIQRIVQGLKDYGAHKEVRREIKNIYIIACQVVALIRDSYPQISFVLRASSKELLTQCDGDQISQVLWNLLNNAVGAVFPYRELEGEIEVELKSTESEIYIVVKDNGPGISEELLERVFEPFYTTGQKGTGLGLSVARTLIEAHGGRIFLRNREEGGVEALLEIPIIRGIE